MVDKSKLAIATSLSKSHSFLIELLFNLLSQMITISTIKLTYYPVRAIGIADFKIALNKSFLLCWGGQEVDLNPIFSSNS